MDNDVNPKNHYRKGVSAIREALVGELVRQKIPGASVISWGGPTGPQVPSTIFAVQANGQTQEMTFTYDDIKESANGTIPEHVFVKVGELVSRFSKAS